jgi:hypothetical protein
MPDAPKELGIKWDSAEDVPVAACNVFVAQFTPHEFTLTFGYATPPAIFRPEDAAKITSVKANTVARLSLSPGRVQELIDVLKRNMEQYQQAMIAATTANKIKH